VKAGGRGLARRQSCLVLLSVELLKVHSDGEGRIHSSPNPIFNVGEAGKVH
jgi:hypothetical protein